jgi:DNA/RNA endonuclease YhcR with UshA esterase domain
MSRFLIPVFLVLAICQTALASKTPSIDARKMEQVWASIGREVAVRGKVVSADKSEADKIRFLDFTIDRQHGFVAAIFPAAYKATGDLKKYKGQRVEVGGILEAYKSKTQIKVTTASQLTLIPKK